MRYVAVIPARGGSTRIPRKNVRSFAGRPVLSYAIDAARAAGVFDDVVVSTDDPEIAETARALGASVPFVRPAELSDDVTAMADVVLHALTTYEQAAGPGSPVDAVCTLFATAPLIRVDDVLRGRDLIEQGAPGAVAVVEFGFPVHRALRLDADGVLEPCWPEHVATRSQDLPTTFHDAGQFYWTRSDVLRAGGGLWPAGMRPVVLEPHRVQDIDTEQDWARAEILHRVLAEQDGAR